MNRHFYLLMLVQFIAALADNTLLIVAIARLHELSAALWAIPLLKLSFVLSYVVLAPMVGPLADTWRKGRVMLGANFLKLVAVLLVFAGQHPLYALALAGLGAAIYAPAKYGLICELLDAEQLVRANGLIEAATVCAVVLGTVLGGFLVSPLLTGGTVTNWVNGFTGAASGLSFSLLVLLALYLVAALLNLGIADSGARYLRHSFHPGQVIRRFIEENRILWRDPLGRLSMSVTTLLWAVGATLQLIVLRWAEESIGLALDQAAYLQGVTALGVIGGASLASRVMTLSNAVKVLPLGVVMGLLVPAMSGIAEVPSAVVLLVVVGAMAGFFVVPMNALLQHRGHTLLTAGRSIAVQGFNENGGVLLMLAIYAGATASQVPLSAMVWCFGILVAVTTLLIMRQRPTGRPADRPQVLVSRRQPVD